MLTTIATGGIIVWEQPGSSSQNMHMRFDWFVSTLRKFGISVAQ
jgi:hypothetical protein